MEELIGSESLVQITALFNQLIVWLESNILVTANLIQLGVILFIYFLSYYFYRISKNETAELLEKIPVLEDSSREDLINSVLRPFIFNLLLWIVVLFAEIFGIPHQLGNIIGNLFTAWIIIKFISIFLPGKFSVRIISFLIWSITALKILNIYDQTVKILGSMAIKSGNLNISLLLVIKGILWFTILFWLARKANTVFNRRIEKSNNLTPSIKVLLNKVTKITLFTVAFLFTLSGIGVDLSTFAFLGGAIGVGLGFGLQKIVSNFISGIIILLDRSIKPGDVVQINDIYGRIKNLNTRFVSVVTRAGKEYLVPNEDFITKKVINWSYSDELVRVEVPIGVGYDSDIELVRELILEAAKDKKRVVNKPEPACLLTSFGDNTVDFKLMFWINDPDNGIANVKSNVLFSVWKLFAEHDVNIAFPQRDLHFESISNDTAEKLKKIFNDQGSKRFDNNKERESANEKKDDQKEESDNEVSNENSDKESNKDSNEDSTENQAAAVRENG